MSSEKSKMAKPQKSQLKICLTGGGTAGHIVPALAVAEKLRQAGHTLCFIGSDDGPERDYVEKAGIPFSAVSAGKLRRYFSFQNFIDFFKLLIGFLQAYRLLGQLRPDCLFAKGGYVALPVILAAFARGIPVVAHESDAILGLVSRLALTKAKIICTGFPVSNYSIKWRRRLRYTGNPVRSIFTTDQPSRSKLSIKHGLAEDLPTILVMGGSQGAKALNDLVLDNLTALTANWQIIHLTGPADAERALQARAKLSPKAQKHYLPIGFVGPELVELLDLSDLVISRAGANTLYELAAMGKPSILVPLPFAANDHQRANAAYFAARQAAISIEQADLTGEKLLDLITALINNKEHRRQLSRAIKALESPRAAELIAEALIDRPQK